MMLKISHLNQYYGNSHTLRDVHLEIPAASCVCVMGRNGVGKTTLLESVMGLTPVRSGEIVYRAKNLLEQPAHQRARQGIGYVPQGRMIFPRLTVEENLRIGLAARANATRQIPPLVYDMFPALLDIGKRRGGDLSGGQQQQLAIGRALVLEPELLILDEPCEGIQPNIVDQIGRVIDKLINEFGVTVVLVEQKLPFARRVAQYFSIMERGRVVAEGEMGRLDDQLINQFLRV